DYLLWYAKDTKHVNFRRQYAEKSASNLENQYTWTRNESAQYAKIAAEELSSFQGERLKPADISSATGAESITYEIDFQGRQFRPPGSRGWSTHRVGMNRLI